MSESVADLLSTGYDLEEAEVFYQAKRHLGLGEEATRDALWALEAAGVVRQTTLWRLRKPAEREGRE